MASRSRIAAVVVAIAAAAGLVVWAQRTPSRGPERATGDAASPSASASSSAVPKATPAPTTGTATVIVYDDGRPEDDRWVVFHDGAGTVSSVAKTGKDGKAKGGVSPGSMVTVVTGSSLKSFTTVQGVDPGDELTIGETEDEGGTAITVCRAMVLLPDAHPRARKHVVSLGVGTTEVPDVKKPLPMAVLKRFVVAGKFPVLAEAIDEKGEAVAFSHATGRCNVDAGAPPDATDGGRQEAPRAVDVKLPAWSTDYRPFAIAIAPASAPATATMDLSLPSGEDQFERGRHEAALEGPTVIRFDGPRPLGTKASFKLSIAYKGSIDRMVLKEKRDQMPERLEIDPKTSMLPRVEGAVLEAGAPAARPVVRWRVAPAPGAPKADAVVVRLAWPATRDYVWTILAPPDSESTGGRLVTPALPDELATLRPDGKGIVPSVALLDASFFDGYRDVKKKGLGALEDPPEAPEGKATVIRWSVTGDLDF